MNVEKREIVKDGVRIRYAIHYKKVKNMTLRISEKGEIIVSCNAFVPLAKVDDFVYRKVAWIVTKQKRMLEKQSRCYEDVLRQDYFYLFDKKLRITRRQSNQNKVLYDDSFLYVYYKEESDMHKSVLRFIDAMCKEKLEPMVEKYYEALQDYRFPYPTIKYRTMTSRWGSCMPRKGQITLNKRLLHYPIGFCEYVVLHELVHFIQPNHSDAFYKIISYHMPDYKIRMKSAY